MTLSVQKRKVTPEKKDAVVDFLEKVVKYEENENARVNFNSRLNKIKNNKLLGSVFSEF